MNLTIDKDKLELLIEKRKSYIGSKWYELVPDLISGITLIVSAINPPNLSGTFLESYAQGIQVFFGMVGLVMMGWSIYRIVRNGCFCYSHQKLCDEIEMLDKHFYSLVAIKDTFNRYPKRLLLYRDEKWNAEFFPAFRTTPGERELDRKNICKLLSTYLEIDESDIKLTFLEEIDNQEKIYKTDDHNEKRVYDHRYYLAEIKRFNKRVKKDQFIIMNRSYRWMTFSEMESNKKIYEKNKEVIETFEKYIG